MIPLGEDDTNASRSFDSSAHKVLRRCERRSDLSETE